MAPKVSYTPFSLWSVLGYRLRISAAGHYVVMAVYVTKLREVARHYAFFPVHVFNDHGRIIEALM